MLLSDAIVLRDQRHIMLVSVFEIASIVCDAVVIAAKGTRQQRIMAGVPSLPGLDWLAADVAIGKRLVAASCIIEREALFVGEAAHSTFPHAHSAILTSATIRPAMSFLTVAT